jgi:hypothetical protein
MEKEECIEDIDGKIRKSLGRPRRRWANNTGMDVGEVDWGDVWHR